jgi:ABC-type molybdate transport system substrate-binding protein
MVTVFAAGVWVDGQSGEAANAFVRFLHSPEAASVFKAKGLDPL